MRGRNGAGTVAVLALVCVFGVTMLAGIFSGAAVYQRVGERVAAAARDRVGLTYVTAKVRAFDQVLPDGESAVALGAMGDSDAVLLREEVNGVDYETILYVYDGQLREMLCLRDSGHDPAFGESISPARWLKASFPKKGLLRLEYGEEDGSTRVADVWLRSGGEQWRNG